MSLYDGIVLAFLKTAVLMGLSFVYLKGQLAIMTIRLDAANEKIDMLTDAVTTEIKRLQSRVG